MFPTSIARLMCKYRCKTVGLSQPGDAAAVLPATP